MLVTEDIIRQIHEDEMYQLGFRQGVEIRKFKEAIRGIRLLHLHGYDVDVPLLAKIYSETEAYILDVQNQMKHEKAILTALKKPGADIQKIAMQWKVSPLFVEALTHSKKKLLKKPRSIKVK